MTKPGLLEAFRSKDEKVLISFLNEDCLLKRREEPLAYGRDHALRALLDIDVYEDMFTFLSYEIVNIRISDEAYQMKIRTKNSQIAAVTIAKNNHRRIRLDIMYDGSGFFGFQRQKKGRTVQKTIEDALGKLFDRKIDVHGASRTDRGVHALGQVIHFDIDNAIPVKKMQWLLNRVLPHDIAIWKAEDVPVVFHARYDALKKTYHYRIRHKKAPFLSRYTALTEPFDLADARRRLRIFEGTHDFTRFSKTPSPDDATRTIFETKIDRDEEETRMAVTGDGFLRHMVRNMIGVVLDDIRKGSENAASVLEGTRGKKPVKPAPAEGLYLAKVSYE